MQTSSSVHLTGAVSNPHNSKCCYVAVSNHLNSKCCNVTVITTTASVIMSRLVGEGVQGWGLTGEGEEVQGWGLAGTGGRVQGRLWN